MKVEIAQRLETLGAAAAVIVPLFESDDLDNVPEVLRVGGEELRNLMRRGAVRATLYDTTLLPSGDSLPSLIFVGAGPHEDFSLRLLVQVVATGSRYLTGRGFSDLAVVYRGTFGPVEFAQAAVEGMVLGAYNADLLKTRHEIERKVTAVTVISALGAEGELRRGAEVGQIVGESKCLARDLVNRPPNELTPSVLAESTGQLALQHGLQHEVMDSDGMREHGMGALLGVAAGSQQPPRFIMLRYGPAAGRVDLALVGKGLTFDSGGLSLKPAEGMVTMKSDMGGAAAVIAGMVAISRLGLKGISVVGYVGATENMPGGGAMRPGDVVTAMNGETIEVLNTDAEGRLVLADVLSYAVAQGATRIVDFATLTGGAVVALGHAATLTAGKPTEWVETVVRAAGAGLEQAWPMPLYSDYRKAMDSEVADIKNTGGREASALTAAAFLSDFVDDRNWAHMDIAGTAWEDENRPYRPKGGTGEGVGTIVSLARSLAGD